MTITQTVEIPASHRLTIDMPHEIPMGRTQVVIQFPVRDEAHTAVPQEAKGQVNNEAFHLCAVFSLLQSGSAFL
jgi:hypothetical protein